MSDRVTTLPGWRVRRSRPGGLDGCCLIIATYRRPTDLLALLQRLVEVSDPPAEVAVVDGAPNDESEQVAAAWVRRADLPFDLAYVRSPAGLTRQRNVGIDATAGELVFFLDDDCLPADGYFRAIQACYRADDAGVVGAVCGFVDNEVGRPLSRRWRLRLALGLVPRLPAGSYFPTATSFPYALGRSFSGTQRVDVMPGCAMSFRRSVLERQRFSMFFAGYAQGEDMEMSRRVAAEHAILWCGDAHAVHNQSPAGRPSSAQKGRMEVRNRHFIWRRFCVRPTLGLRMRFWADLSFGLACDLGGMIAHPGSLAPLRHASGLVRGMVSCLIAPPRFDEPQARREYAIAWTDVPAACGDVAVTSSRGLAVP